MTAQVLIITKEGIVCSSDQAATMSDGKTYDGMRKIFKLTDLLPAEIMYNGNADFENFSMEALISKFKNTVDFEELKTMKKVKLTLTIKKKKFTAKTNKKGKATFKIKKLSKKGKHTAKVTFKGNKNFKKMTKTVKIKVKK